MPTLAKRDPTKFLKEEYQKIQAEGREWVHRKLETPSETKVLYFYAVNSLPGFM